MGVIVALSLAATFTSEPGHTVADNRLEEFTAPNQYLARHAYLWDDARSLGKPTYFFSPAPAALRSAVAITGAAPWVIERLNHALYLSLAALGVILLMSAFLPRIGFAHALAAFVYTFSPFSSQFLLPSDLFLAYALAPWLAWFAIRGLRDGDPWRWAAALALATAAFGALNAAALGLALVPAALTAIYISITDRRGIGPLWRLAWRSGLLTVVTCSAAIVVLWFSGPDISVNLRTTELPENVARTSSWFESWRGLGMWLNYFGSPLALGSQATAPYFTAPVVIAASFVAPLGALLVLALGRWRHRLLFGSMLLISLVLMVGIHGAGQFGDQDRSPFGQLLSFAFDHWEFARGFRTTYKAGPGLMLAIAVLLGIGVASLARRVRSGGPTAEVPPPGRRRLAVVLGVAVVLMGLIAASFPFWTGGLYAESSSFGSIPRYWTHAFRYLGERQQPGRVLVLPGSSRAIYRWGFVNDNLFDGLSPLSPLINQTLPQGTPESADLVNAIDEYVASPGYVRGTLAPILARLGVRWVLIQNDLNWQLESLPRPATYDRLRTDPGLRLAAKFGRPGLNTTAPSDSASRALGERSLPPVEVYEVAGDPSPRPRLAAGPPLLVSGAGDSWPSLAAGRLLGGPPVAYTGAASHDALRQMIGLGSRVVVTDGNRRRVTQATSGRQNLSVTLGSGESYRRPADDLFGDLETQSLATYPDAASISASTSPTGGTPPKSPSDSPASAFDRVRRTAWVIDPVFDPTGQSLTVDLSRPQAINAISVLPRANGSRRIEAMDVIMRSEGGGVTRRRLRFDGAPGERSGLRVDVSGVSSIELRIARVRGGGGTVGIAEVGVETPDGPLDLREFVRTPEDLATRAAADVRLGAALAARPPRYELRRSVGTDVEDEETELRREIFAFGDHRYSLDVTARVDGRTAETAVDRLLDAPVGAVGSSRSGLFNFGHRGGLAVDDDVSTTWEPDPEVGERLHVRFPETTVHSIEVLVLSGQTPGGTRSRVTNARVSVGNGRGRESAASALPRSPRCIRPKARTGGCLERHVVHVRPTEANGLTVSLTGLESVGGRFALDPPSVAEARINGRHWSSFAHQSRRKACFPLVAVDGQPIGIRLPTHPEDILAGRQLDLKGCEPVRLTPGIHRIETLPGLSGAVLTASLVPPGWNAVGRGSRRRSGGPGTVKLVDRSPTRWQLQLDAPKDAELIGGMPWHEGWSADSDRLDPSPVPLDTFAAWTVESRTAGPVTLDFEPQRIYELAMALSIAAAAWCLWRVTRRRERKSR